MTSSPSTTKNQLVQLIQQGLEELPLSATAHPVWTALSGTGTELWLDTGAMEVAEDLWSAEFTALTTNNSLLNQEIQKGIYDEWVSKAAAAALADQPQLSEKELILEIAFALNARHGLRLNRRFGARVSVELHTDLACDTQASVAYGRRYAALCKDFIVKVPLTPEGLVAAKILEEEGIPVNFTLGFSARENLVIASIAKVSWVNVFLGRLNAWVHDEGLGDGAWVGERTTLATQAVLRRLAQEGSPTKLIAASLRNGEQCGTLAGLDVFTMPPPVAQGFLDSKPELSAIADQTAEDYQPTWADGVNPNTEGLSSLWDIEETLFTTCAELARIPSSELTGDLIRTTLADAGHESIFPQLTAEEDAILASEGKVPKRSSWQHAVSGGKVGLDALFTKAGLFAFAKDQAALDERVLANC